MGDRRFLLRVGALLAAGLVGGSPRSRWPRQSACSAGSTTIREVAPEPDRTPVVFAQGGGLTYGDIYAAYASGVVQVEATGPLASDPFDPFPRRTRSLGSGFVIEKSGHIVTNFHVVEGAEIVTVSFSNDESVRAKVVGIDPTTDLAVLKVNTPPRGLTPLRLGRSTSVRVGDEVVAIGNPFGYERSMTAGIVSAIGRVLEAPNDARDRQRDPDGRADQPGQLGGPLLNALGQVIGVNTQIATGSSSDPSVGVGFAIPVDTVRSVTAQIIRVGKVEHAFFGIEATPLTDDIARLFRLPEQARQGLVIDSVVPDSAADKAGLRAGNRTVIVGGESWRLGGDIIVAVDGDRVSTPERLRSILARKRPGDKIEVEVYRADRRLKLTVKLGRAPAAE